MGRLGAELRTLELERQHGALQLRAAAHTREGRLAVDRQRQLLDLDLLRELTPRRGRFLFGLGRGRLRARALADAIHQALRLRILERQLAVESANDDRLGRLFAAQPQPERAGIDHDVARDQRRTARLGTDRKLADRDLREPERYVRHSHRQPGPRGDALLHPRSHHLRQRKRRGDTAAQNQRRSDQPPKGYAAIEPQDALRRCC